MTVVKWIKTADIKNKIILNLSNWMVDIRKLRTHVMLLKRARQSFVYKKFKCSGRQNKIDYLDKLILYFYLAYTIKG